LLALFSLLGAKTLRYEVRLSFFGVIAAVDIDYFNDGKRYLIKGASATYGTAKKLSKNRREFYYSKGFVKNGFYYTTFSKWEAISTNKKEFREYKFNYKRKKIELIKKKWVDGKLKENIKRYLKFFTKNDLVALYHNIVRSLYRTKKAGMYRFKAAGVEKYGGDVFVYVPPKRIQEEEAEDMDAKGCWIMHIITRKKILKSKRGELVFAIDKDGIAKSVRLLDVPWVGSLTAKRVR